MVQSRSWEDVYGVHMWCMVFNTALFFRKNTQSADDEMCVTGMVMLTPVHWGW